MLSARCECGHIQTMHISPDDAARSGTTPCLVGRGHKCPCPGYRKAEARPPLTRDVLLAEVSRSLRHTHPDRAEEMIAALEKLLDDSPMAKVAASAIELVADAARRVRDREIAT